MRSPPKFRMSVTRRGEKEQKLATFIAHGLASVAQSAKPPQGEGILVIARSLQSPVVRAVAARATEIAAASCIVRMILAKTDRSALPSGWANSPLMLNCKARLARDPRLIEAHEQLVVGQGACWTGDSMRRDPATCDAYESFVDDCPQTAGAATMMFERLWAGSEPLFECGPSSRDGTPAPAPSSPSNSF